MAAQVGALRVAVGADITGLQAGMKRAERQVQRSAGVMQTAVVGLNKSFAGLGSVGAVSLGGAGVLAGAAAFLKIADAAKTMQAQLKLATNEFGNLAQAQKDVRGIAERTRSDLVATSELYAGIQRQAGRFGVTQAQAARITESLTKSLKISGTTGEQAAQAIRQFGQAFTQGNLNSDEFRTMRELAPRAMKAIADATGKAEGELKKLSAAGKLDIPILVKAFTDLKIAAGIDKDFEQLPVTFSDAMTKLYNSAIITFSAFDEGGQFSNSIAAFFTKGSQGFADLEKSAYDWGVSVNDTFLALDQVRLLLVQIGQQGPGAFDDTALATLTWNDALSGTLWLLDEALNKFANLYNLPGNIIRKVMGDEIIVDPSDMQGGFAAATGESRGSAAGRLAGTIWGQLKPQPKLPPYKPPAGDAKKAKKPPRDRSEDVAFKFENELRQAQMDILRAQQELAGTSGERSELALKMLDLEAQQFNAALDNDVRKAQRDFAEGKITETALREIEVHAEALRGKQVIVDQLKRQAIAQEATLHRMEREATLAERVTQNKIDGLQFDDEMATTQADHRRIQLDILDTLYKQKEAHLRALKAQLEFAGKIEEAADVQAQIDLLPVERAREQTRIETSTRNPIEEWAASVPQSAAEITEALQGIQVNALDGLTDSLMGLIDGTQSLADAFGDMARSIISDIIRMTIRMLIFRVISGMFGGGTGAVGANSMGGNLASQAAFPPRAAGGPVQGGKTYLVGEHGPELFQPYMSGSIVPNNQLSQRIGNNDNGGGPVEVRVTVEASDDLYVKAAVIADHRIRAAAPQIIKTAANATLRAAGRPKLMGR